MSKNPCMKFMTPLGGSQGRVPMITKQAYLLMGILEQPHKCLKAIIITSLIEKLQYLYPRQANLLREIGFMKKIYPWKEEEEISLNKISEIKNMNSKT